MKHLLFCLAISLGLASLSACAQAPQTGAPGATASKPAPGSVSAGAADQRVRQALLKLNPQVQIEYVGPSTMPGFREAIVGGQLVLVSEDGKYLVQGAVVDIASETDLIQSSPSLPKYRAGLLNGVAAKDRIVFAPPNAKYTISVFTDIECGFCRKLHSEMAEYNRRGIAVEYLAYPRMGLGSQDHRDMISVWCAADRKRALTDAKGGQPIPQRQCQSTPVDMEYHLGRRLGITGTPAVFAPDGTLLGGYLPPDKMREALDALAGNAAAAPPAGMN